MFKFKHCASVDTPANGTTPAGARTRNSPAVLSCAFQILQQDRIAKRDKAQVLVRGPVLNLDPLPLLAGRSLQQGNIVHGNPKWHPSCFLQMMAEISPVSKFGLFV
jgi:hypothetical protein